MRPLGMLLAGGILLILADIAPKFAVGTAGVLLLAEIIINPQELQNAANFINGAVLQGSGLGKS